MLLAEKSTADALAAFEKAAAADPRLVEARFQIAEISMGYKDFKKAIANYDAITKIDDKNSAAFVNMGVALKGSARFAEAEAAYKKALEVGGDKPLAEAHFNLGVLYLRNLNRPEDAKAELKKYLQVGQAAADDPAFGLLEEIEKGKAMEEEKKQEEELKKRMDEAETRAKSSGEPTDPTAPIPAPKK